jgi:hypothetical protein
MGWVILALLALYPCELSESDAPGPARPAGPGWHEAAKPKLELQKRSSLDREAFLLAFKQQAGRSLISCLREQVGPTGRVTFVARLHRNGRLSGSRLLIANSHLDCAVEALSAMSFTAATQTMNDESTEITWRFDW